MLRGWNRSAIFKSGHARLKTQGVAADWLVNLNAEGRHPGPMFPSHIQSGEHAFSKKRVLCSQVPYKAGNIGPGNIGMIPSNFGGRRISSCSWIQIPVAGWCFTPRAGKVARDRIITAKPIWRGLNRPKWPWARELHVLRVQPVCIAVVSLCPRNDHCSVDASKTLEQQTLVRFFFFFFLFRSSRLTMSHPNTLLTVKVIWYGSRY